MVPALFDWLLPQCLYEADDLPSRIGLLDLHESLYFSGSIYDDPITIALSIVTVSLVLIAIKSGLLAA